MKFFREHLNLRMATTANSHTESSSPTGREGTQHSTGDATTLAAGTAGTPLSPGHSSAVNSPQAPGVPSAAVYATTSPPSIDSTLPAIDKTMPTFDDTLPLPEMTAGASLPMGNLFSSTTEGLGTSSADQAVSQLPQEPSRQNGGLATASVPTSAPTAGRTVNNNEPTQTGVLQPKFGSLAPATNPSHMQTYEYQLTGDSNKEYSHSKHKKDIKRRTKTGCLTCRKRRIKVCYLSLFFFFFFFFLVKE